MKNIIHRIVASAVFVLASISVAATASAAEVTRTSIPKPDDGTSSACGFQVQLKFLNWNVVSTSFSNAGPLVEIDDGVAILQLTNLGTGKTITHNISGITTIKVFSDGSKSIAEAGPWIHFGPPGSGLPPMFLTEGLVTFTYDSAGNLVSLNASGRLVDLCAELSG